ncbi:hypothetical protein RRG08_010507 [Elysia crispata]|uniref:Uncharacterized protein n=1 Tax=Elysia crispata TaxID=231223 RepID=A0AAE1APV5_9GAST|nr:hypothetical protein RRG08_010507 [Elysia crispata]
MSRPAANVRDEPQRPQNARVPAQRPAHQMDQRESKRKNASTLTRSHRDVGTNTRKRDQGQAYSSGYGRTWSGHSESTTSRGGEGNTKLPKSEESLRGLIPPSHGGTNRERPPTTNSDNDRRGLCLSIKLSENRAAQNFTAKRSRRMTLRQAQMCKLLQERGIHVILAQEVLLGSGKSYSLPGYEMHHCTCMEGKKKCRGIATFIRRRLKARVENIKAATGTDAQKIALWWDGKRFDLVNWYQPPSDKRVSLDIGESVHRYK